MFHVRKWIDVWQDMCNFSDNWWMDGRCSRAIVDGLAPLLLKKLLLRSTLQPLVLLLGIDANCQLMPTDVN